MPLIITPEMYLLISLALDVAVRRTLQKVQEMSAEERAAEIKKLEAEKALIDAELQAIVNA